MFAILSTGGKQYKVEAGQYLKVEKLSGSVGDEVSFDNIMLSGDSKNTALGKGLVKAEIVEQGKDDKVIIFKKKRRQNYRRKNGHRQHITTLLVTSVSNGKDTINFEKKKKSETSENKESKKNENKASTLEAKQEKTNKEG